MKRVTLFYIFSNLDFWLKRRQLDAHIGICTQSVEISQCHVTCRQFRWTLARMKMRLQRGNSRHSRRGGRGDVIRGGGIHVPLLVPKFKTLYPGYKLNRLCYLFTEGFQGMNWVSKTTLVGCIEKFFQKYTTKFLWQCRPTSALKKELD